MSFVQVDSSVRTNRKFLRAGPAASWLWLCGNAYCQETLTDGFIPFEAIRYLGVQSPQPLIPKLVKAGLWDVVDGGWCVHDYLEHNKSADEIRRLKKRRGEGGKLGGRPPKEPSSETLEVTEKVNLSENPSTPTPTPTSAPTATTSSTATDTPHEKPARPQSLIHRRRLDAAWEGPKVYVPQRIHTDFLAFRGGTPEAERELFAWYEEISDDYTNGELMNMSPGSDMFAFWRARFDEKWPAPPKTKADPRVPVWAR